MCLYLWKTCQAEAITQLIQYEKLPRITDSKELPVTCPKCQKSFGPDLFVNCLQPVRDPSFTKYLLTAKPREVNSFCSGCDQKASDNEAHNSLTCLRRYRSCCPYCWKHLLELQAPWSHLKECTGTFHCENSCCEGRQDTELPVWLASFHSKHPELERVLRVWIRVAPLVGERPQDVLPRLIRMSDTDKRQAAIQIRELYLRTNRLMQKKHQMGVTKETGKSTD